MKSKKTHTCQRDEIRIIGNAGFTLIELMIAIAIFGIVVAGVIGAFWDQLRSHNTQQQILGMQQNARAAMYFITREIQMAGFNPSGNADAGVQADNAVRTTTTFSMDLNDGANDGTDNDGDGDIDELSETSDAVTYALVNDQIIRTDQAGNAQILADNIEVLDFRYHGIDPADPTEIDYAFAPAEAAANPDNLRSVNVSIIARADRVPVVSHQVRDTTQYRNLDGDMLLNKAIDPDNFRRIMLSKRIKLRNMGLE
jgi:type IV pilus assembly protein PilW